MTPDMVLWKLNGCSLPNSRVVHLQATVKSWQTEEVLELAPIGVNPPPSNAECKLLELDYGDKISSMLLNYDPDDKIEAVSVASSH